MNFEIVNKDCKNFHESLGISTERGMEFKELMTLMMEEFFSSDISKAEIIQKLIAQAKNDNEIVALIFYFGYTLGFNRED